MEEWQNHLALVVLLCIAFVAGYAVSHHTYDCPVVNETVCEECETCVVCEDCSSIDELKQLLISQQQNINVDVTDKEWLDEQQEICDDEAKYEQNCSMWNKYDKLVTRTCPDGFYGRPDADMGCVCLKTECKLD